MSTKETATMPKTDYSIEPGKQEMTSTTVIDRRASSCSGRTPTRTCSPAGGALGG